MSVDSLNSILFLGTLSGNALMSLFITASSASSTVSGSFGRRTLTRSPNSLSRSSLISALLKSKVSPSISTMASASRTELISTDLSNLTITLVPPVKSIPSLGPFCKNSEIIPASRRAPEMTKPKRRAPRKSILVSDRNLIYLTFLTVCGM